METMDNNNNNNNGDDDDDRGMGRRRRGNDSHNYFDRMLDDSLKLNILSYIDRYDIFQAVRVTCKSFANLITGSTNLYLINHLYDVTFLLRDDENDDKNKSTSTTTTTATTTTTTKTLTLLDYVKYRNTLLQQQNKQKRSTTTITISKVKNIPWLAQKRPKFFMTLIFDSLPKKKLLSGSNSGKLHFPLDDLERLYHSFEIEYLLQNYVIRPKNTSSQSSSSSSSSQSLQKVVAVLFELEIWKFIDNRCRWHIQEHVRRQKQQSSSIFVGLIRARRNRYRHEIRKSVKKHMWLMLNDKSEHVHQAYYNANGIASGALKDLLKKSDLMEKIECQINKYLKEMLSISNTISKDGGGDTTIDTDKRYQILDYCINYYISTAYQFGCMLLRISNEYNNIYEQYFTTLSQHMIITNEMEETITGTTAGRHGYYDNGLLDEEDEEKLLNSIRKDVLSIFKSQNETIQSQNHNDNSTTTTTNKQDQQQNKQSSLMCNLNCFEQKVLQTYLDLTQ